MEWPELPRFVLVVGKRATGKTTLLRDIVQRLHRRVADVTVCCQIGQAYWLARGARVLFGLPGALPADRPQLLVVEDCVAWAPDDIERFGRNVTAVVAIQHPRRMSVAPDVCCAFRDRVFTNRDRIHRWFFSSLERGRVHDLLGNLDEYNHLVSGPRAAVHRARIDTEFVCNKTGPADRDLRLAWPADRPAPCKADEQRMSCDIVVACLAYQPGSVRAASMVCAAWRRALDTVAHPVEFVVGCRCPSGCPVHNGTENNGLAGQVAGGEAGGDGRRHQRPGA